MTKPRAVSVHSWPEAILHIDGDSFFAACEQAVHAEYRGKPLVVGGERGIATAMSREAKALGITRGMQNGEIARRFPQCVIVPSDYETYSIFSERMLSIVRRHTPAVEAYSIDECFADLTGLRKAKRQSYEDIAKTIKSELQSDLGLTFSLGLSVNKTMAKVATSWRKPDGFTAIKARHIHYALAKLDVGDIWGIGPQTAARLEKLGVKNALVFAHKSEDWVAKNFSKPQIQIHRELNGGMVKKLELEKAAPKSISKTKSFTPASTDDSYVFSQLSKNIENACIKARRHGMYTDSVSFFLKTQGFETAGRKARLSIHTNNPHELLRVARTAFDELFQTGTAYRTTGVRLGNLRHESAYQPDLFHQHVEVEKLSGIYDIVDQIDSRFGKHSIYLASSLRAITEGNHQGERGTSARRKRDLLSGENSRQRIGIPYLGMVR
ncbi:MAG: DNA polymerase IV [Candidatus Paceibacterota bacterium]